MSGSHAYEEFGAILADGPHRGMVVATFRSLSNAEDWAHEPPKGKEGSYVIRCRHVTKGDWGPILGDSHG